MSWLNDLIEIKIATSSKAIFILLVVGWLKNLNFYVYKKLLRKYTSGSYDIDDHECEVCRS